MYQLNALRYLSKYQKKNNLKILRLWKKNRFKKLFKIKNAKQQTSQRKLGAKNL